MTRLIFFLIMLISLSAIKAQNGLKEIKTGQTLPPVRINNILNFKGNAATIADLHKEKFLLLDFWATYCSPCVKLLPTLDSLQTEFKDRLQVISASVQDAKTLKNFFSSKKIMSKDIYYIADDTILMQYFPYKFIPHVVWINPDGKVIAITSEREVTRENIRSVLSGQTINMTEKKDDIHFDYRKPYDPDFSLVRYKSLLTGYNDGIGGGMLIDPLLIKPTIHYADSLKRIFIWNNDIASLFYIAFTRYTCPFPNFNRIVIETGDTSAVKRPENYLSIKNWEKNNLYCYEMILDKVTDNKDFFNYMFDDLNRFFPVKASIEKRNIPCWVITDSLHNKNLLQSAGGEEKIEWESGGIMHKLQNKTMGELMLYLNAFPNSLPVVDETGITGKIDIETNIETDTSGLDINKLKRTLNKYGLTISKANRNLDVIVINEKSPG